MLVPHVIVNDAKSNVTHARVRVVVSVAAVIAMCAFIFLMSHEPAEQSDELSLGVAWNIVSILVPGYGDMSSADQLEWQKMLNHPVRKTAHFLEYAALGALMLNMLMQISRLREIGLSTDARSGSGKASDSPPRSLRDPAYKRSLVILAWLLTTFYASTDEVHQMFVAGRAGMVTDVLLDSTGALTGVLLCWLLFFRTRHRTR